MFSFDYVKKTDPEVAAAMEAELSRQRDNLELIASENLVSPAVMAAMGRISWKTLLWRLPACGRGGKPGQREGQGAFWL